MDIPVQRCGAVVTKWETTYTEEHKCETLSKDECQTVQVEKTRVEQVSTEVSNH